MSWGSASVLPPSRAASCPCKPPRWACGSPASVHVNESDLERGGRDQSAGHSEALRLCRAQTRDFRSTCLCGVVWIFLMQASTRRAWIPWTSARSMAVFRRILVGIFPEKKQPSRSGGRENSAFWLGVCASAGRMAQLKHPNRATLYLLYTSLCTGELNAIQKHNCFLCSPFYVKGVSLGYVGRIKT